jgi:hypothetical protein
MKMHNPMHHKSMHMHKPMHHKSMHKPMARGLTTPEEVDLWLLAHAPKALELQGPPSDDVLRIVASGEKEDGPREDSGLE